MSLNEMLADTGPKPPKICIYGPAGAGKTSLAYMMPSPIGIQVEAGLASVAHMKPAAFPPVSTFQEIIDQVKAVGNDDTGEYKTLVIDSITKAAVLCERELLADEGKDNLAACRGGYGAGYQYVAERLGQLKFLCDKLSEHRNMAICFVAHEAVTNVQPPDSEPYSQFTLRMNHRYIAPFVDDVDICAHVRISSVVFGAGEKKRARSDGTRIIQLTSGPATVAKNRYGLTEDVAYEAGTNPLLSLIPYFNQEN